MSDEVDRLRAEVVAMVTQGDHVGALPRARAAVDAAARWRGTESASYAEALSDLGVVLAGLGRWHEARDALGEAKSVLAAVGSEVPSRAAVATNLARVYSELGDTATARQEHELAIAIARSSGDTITLVRSLSGLAHLHRVAGQLDWAEALIREAVELSLGLHGREDPRSLRLLNDLASVHFDLGALDRAESIIQDVMNLWRNAVGEDAQYAVYLYNLGMIRQRTERPSEARHLFRRALEIRREVGDVSGQADTLIALARLALSESDPEAVRDWTAEAVKLIIDSDEALPDAGTKLGSAAGILLDVGDEARAEELLKAVVDIQRVVYGESDTRYAAALNNLAHLYFEQHMYDKAEPLYQRALEIVRRHSPDDDLVVASAAQNLANVYWLTSRLEPALALHDEVLRLRRTRLGGGHPLVVRSLLDVAELALGLGQIDRAVGVARSAVVRTRDLGKENPLWGEARQVLADATEAFGNTAAAESIRAELARGGAGRSDEELTNHDRLRLRAQEHHRRGDYRTAEKLYRQALEAATGDDHADELVEAGISSDLAALCLETGDMSEASELANRALDVRRRRLGPAHPATAGNLLTLAQIASARGQYDQAEGLLTDALNIVSAGDADGAIAGADDPTGVALSALAAVYQARGDYAAAVRAAEAALDRAREHYGEDDANFGTALANLAAAYEHMGRPLEAEPLRLRALEVSRDLLGSGHPDVGSKLLGLGNLYRTLGRYEKAEPLLRQALEIAEATFGPAHKQVAQATNELGVLAFEVGRHAEAEIWLRRTLVILENSEDNPDSLAHLLGNLSVVYRAIGDLGRATTILEEALEITHNSGGATTKTGGWLRILLGLTHLEAGRLSAAEACLREAMEMLRGILPGHPVVASGLTALARLYFQIGAHKTGEAFEREALAIDRRAYGETHPLVAMHLNNLAILHQHRGEAQQAEDLFRRAIELERARQGGRHPDIAGPLANLAVHLAGLGRVDEALPLLEEAARIDDQTVEEVFPVASEQQRMSYVHSMGVRYGLYLSVLWTFCRDDPGSAQTAFDFVLRRKGLATYAVAAQRTAVLAAGDPELTALWNQLADIRAEIAALVLTGGEATTGDDVALRAARERREDLERRLARRLAYAPTGEGRPATRQEVVAAIPAAGALVEYVQFELSTFALRGSGAPPADHYVAFLLHSGEPDGVMLVDIGPASVVDPAIASFRLFASGEGNEGAARQLRVPSSAVIGTPGTDLAKLVIEPVLDALPATRHLLLSPDGAMNRLPFGVLPSGHRQGDVLIDEYVISYVSTGRDIQRFGQSAPPPGPALVVGDPDYEFADTREADRDAPTEGRHSRALRASGVVFTPLPETRHEAELIARLLGVAPLVGSKALERTVKRHQSPGVMHLATHGFFLEPQKHDYPPDYAESIHALEVPGEGIFVTEITLPAPDWSTPLLGGRALPESPLLRSGLALAGANRFLRGESLPADAEDGLLTAEDVSALDLTATRLVVLSACDTGLGELQVGEGVLGLRRAVMLAGARTLVMSLWKVPDQETKDLMVDFYARLASDVPPTIALREAQQALRARRPEPRYWGAFICQGDPSPIPWAELVSGSA